ncbi:efflux RND transporter periplasmic adaptor subunit [Aurantimonas sp. Leaf443]|uniref:efflux RND transporter periplasmic adaptor subunit n=1 Tax=Aurantimonas sp. Leaf443 TaxID=1736378 RepID=UPI0006FF4AB0|nr:efflux RND transporter periplasmic adaptor subunit [Aurantimonas sp. Leaf443]KQT88173.1 hypothetical protein ASG48_01655 [Aurantimonas sp. Leaf443]
MKPVRIAIAGLLVAAAGVGGLYGSGFLLDRFMPQDEASAAPRAERRARVEVAQARREPVRLTAEAIGSTKAIQSIDVQPMADGRVVAVNIEEGSDVRAGTVLVQLDDRAERAALKEADASLAEVRSAYQRSLSLAERNVQSDAALESTRAQVLRAEAVREQAANAVADRQAIAAFDGRVGLSEVDVGQRVTTASILTTLDDLSRIEVTFSLPEAYLAQVRPGQVVVARSDAFPDRPFEGKVETIDTRVDAASRAFAVRATIPNADRSLVTGMFLQIALVIEERQSVTVPEVAVVNEGDRTHVFAATADKAERREVRIGLRRDGRVEILEGLDEGVPVVVSGLQGVEDGAAVEIVAPAGGDGKNAPPRDEGAPPAPTASAAGGGLG